MSKTRPIEIECQQVLKRDASVFSIQRVIIPQDIAAVLSPDFVMERYFSYLRRVTLTLARPLKTANGVEFRFLFTRFHLLAFAHPIYSKDSGAGTVTLRICGGTFVQGDQCNRGRFAFICDPVPEGVRVTVSLSDYFPRLLGDRTPSRFRIYIYRFTQAFIHKIVTTRFLAALYREVTGANARMSIAQINLQEGENL